MRIGGAIPAGSGRGPRLDPLSLPVRFEANDAAADGRVRSIELHRERVVVRRAVRGMRMALNLPVHAYRGVAIRVIAPTADTDGAIAVILEHHDDALSLVLHRATDAADVMQSWQAWAQALDCPLLVHDANEPDAVRRLGDMILGEAPGRRRRRNAHKARRPSILMRRKPGCPAAEPMIHREDEIIARN